MWQRVPKPCAMEIVLGRPLKPDEILGHIGDRKHLAERKPPQVGEDRCRLLPGAANPGQGEQQQSEVSAPDGYQRVVGQPPGSGAVIGQFGAAGFDAAGIAGSKTGP